ncbi:peptidase M61 [gamma proteobacterium HTCC5015]|nr:peptidase M61 [gamma proteobacterium HTCC5015]
MSCQHYSICPADPAGHYFDVRLSIPRPDAAGQLLRLPVWIPGSYMVRDFSRNIVELRALAAGQPVAVERHSKSEWLCAPCEGELVVEYRVYAWDLSVRSAHLDTTHGFFNGTSVFLEVVGQSESACEVFLEKPSHPECQSWRVATALPEAGAERYGFGGYRASNYDELIDHPVEMGDFDLATFEACGVSHDIVLSGRHSADMDRLCRDLKTICEHHIRFFGEPAPVDRYVFLTMVTGDGYGGLEHRASTALMTSRRSLPRVGVDSVDKHYRNFLGLCSHEYFHTWNVKRIKPAVFSPFDLSGEQHTRLLWAFEGITSYYDDLALVRTGLISQRDYLEQLAQTLSRVWRGRGRFRQTVTESSFDAWTRFYKQDENAPNAIVSYYAKGAVIALCLDALLQQSGSSLDQLMALLWERHAEVGVGEREIEDYVAELAGEPARHTLCTWLYSTEDPDVAAALEQFGVSLNWRAPEGQDDWGSVSTDNDAAPSGASPQTIGVRCVAAPEWGGLAKLTVVYEGEPAHRAGLSAGDVLVAMDGLKVTAADWESRVAQALRGQPIRVHAFRRDELMAFDVVPEPAARTAAELRMASGSERLRQSWLRGQ